MLASLPYVLGVTTVIFGKHVDKLDMDKVKNIHTLPVVIGEKAARYAILVMMIAPYLLTVYLIVAKFLYAGDGDCFPGASHFPADLS